MTGRRVIGIWDYRHSANKTSNSQQALKTPMKASVQYEQPPAAESREDEEQQRDRQQRRYFVPLHRAHDQEAKAALRGEEFTYQGAQEGEREANAEAREDLRHGCRHEDTPADLDRGHAHHPGGAEVDGRYLSYRIHGEDDHRDDDVDGAEGDLCGHAEPEDQQDYRVEGNLRHGIEGDKNRFRHLPRQPVTAQDHADQEAPEEGVEQRQTEGRHRLPDIGPEARIPQK